MAKKTDSKTKTVKKGTKKVSSKTATKKTAKTKPAVKKKSTIKEKKVVKPQKTTVKGIQKIEPEVKKAPKKIKGYSKQELDFFKELIMTKRAEIIEQMQNLKEQMMDPITGQYVNENSPYSLHMAEQGTDASEREKLFLWAQRENKFLGYLEEALRRIENGTYGICIECMDEPKNLCPTCPLIPKERLIAVPHTQLCVQVKELQEKK